MELVARRIFGVCRNITGMALHTIHHKPLDHPPLRPENSVETPTSCTSRDSGNRLLSQSKRASTIAMKLAVGHALSTTGVSTEHHDIEIRRSEDGVPSAHLSLQASKKAAAKGIGRLLLSATNDNGTSLAVSTVVGGDCCSVTESGNYPLGIGVDLVFHKTAAGLFSDCSHNFLTRMFTESEVREAFRHGSNQSATQTLLGMVAAKEAVFKAVSEGYSNSKPPGLSSGAIDASGFLDIEVLAVRSDRPVVRLLNRMPDIAGISGIRAIDVGVMITDDFAGAVALSTGPHINNISQVTNDENL